MPKPKIRHLAIWARDPKKLAAFYQEVLEMELVNADTKTGAYFVSDGYLTLALLPHSAAGSPTVGLNHFGFEVEDGRKIDERLKARGDEELKKRPADRPYAETRGADPEGNMFDISEHGFERVETDAMRQRKKEPA